MTAALSAMMVHARQKQKRLVDRDDLWPSLCCSMTPCGDMVCRFSVPRSKHFAFETVDVACETGQRCLYSLPLLSTASAGSWSCL